MFGIKILSVLFMIFLLSFTGILIFLKGFLLTRSVIEDKSECLVEFALRAEDNHSHHSKGCWMHSRFKKAIIVIIDALKYEFMEYNESMSINVSQDVFFKNKLPILHHLQIKEPLNTRLYKFIADAPTTTMQRLKGLTTGSLPTFVDAGANFKSYEITEDTFIEQLVKQNKKIKFFGDDTWLGLFPNKFFKTFGFPSFNIRDLHSVDDGILENIYPEIKKSDWDVIITHFLGVDHCGHRYGPNYPAMRDKLLQMNAFLRNITKLMKDDMILFVMGDHGMTNSGDHGGDSIAELEAGLFIYSPAQITSSRQHKTDDNIVRQVDFTPTISLLLGLPIPFSNLGMVITDLFTHCPWWNTASNDIRQAYHKIKALRLNAHQMNNYISAYQKQASDLPVQQLRNLQLLFAKAEQEIQSHLTLMAKEGVNSDTVAKLHSIENSYKLFIREIRQICENVWAKFDLSLMFVGILTIAVGVTQSLYFLVIWTNEEVILPGYAQFLLGGSAIHFVCLSVHLLIFPSTVPLMPITTAVLLIILNCSGLVFSKLLPKMYFTLENFTSSILLLINCGLYFSNSFVVYEDEISIFLLQTLVSVYSVSIIISKAPPCKVNLKAESTRHLKKSKSNFDILQVILHPKMICFLTCLIIFSLLRISSAFIPCREEQISCIDSVFCKPLASLERATKNKRYIFSVISLMVMVYGSKQGLRHFGNLNGTSPGVVCMQYGPPLAALFICFHWALQGLSDLDSDYFTPWQLALMAQAAYIIIVACIVTVTFWPLLIFVLPTRSDSSLHLSHKADLQNIIPTIYNQLKLNFQSNVHESDNEKAPSVYGLGSAYSAAVFAVLVLIGLLLSLMLNDGTAPSLLVGMLVLYLCLELYSALTVSRMNWGDNSATPSWGGLVFLNLLSTVFFYVTGHQATFPSIRYEAAYVGFYGDFNSFILPGFLIWLNTFAGPIFFSLAGPLLIFWPLLSSGLSCCLVVKKLDKTWQGDFSLFDNGIRLKKNLFTLICGTIFIGSVKLMCAAAAAALHRRHLMVWKIFAPRLVYESALFITISSCMFLAYFIVLRVDNALVKFVNHIQPKKKK